MLKWALLILFTAFGLAFFAWWYYQLYLWWLDIKRREQKLAERKVARQR